MATVGYFGTMAAATDWGITLFHVVRGLDFVLPESGEILQDIERDVKAFLDTSCGSSGRGGSQA